MIRHGDARLANKAARASARVAAARAARLVGGDGVSGDGHALKNTVSRTGKTVRRVRRSSSDGRGIWIRSARFESDDGSVVSYGSSPDSLGVRSGDSSDDDAPRVRLARESAARFERVRVVSQRTRRHRRRSLLGARRTREQTVGVPAAPPPRGGGLRRERLEARDARSGPPRGLTLTQSASPQEELRWAQGPCGADRERASRKDAPTRFAARRVGPVGPVGFGAVGTRSHLQNARDTSYL